MTDMTPITYAAGAYTAAQAERPRPEENRQSRRFRLATRGHRLPRCQPTRDLFPMHELSRQPLARLRVSTPGVEIPTHLEPLEIGKAELRRESSAEPGRRVALLAFGSLNGPAVDVAEALDATHLNMRSVKPLDRAAILAAAADHDLLVTLEENVVAGGAGSGVNELLAAEGVQIALLNLGLPDVFVEHGKPDELLTECGLDAAGIEASIRARLG